MRQFESLGGRKGEKSDLKSNFQKFGYKMCVLNVGEVLVSVHLSRDKKKIMSKCGIGKQESDKVILSFGRDTSDGVRLWIQAGQSV